MLYVSLDILLFPVWHAAVTTVRRGFCKLKYINFKMKSGSNILRENSSFYHLWQHRNSSFHVTWTASVLYPDRLVCYQLLILIIPIWSVDSHIFTQKSNIQYAKLQSPVPSAKVHWLLGFNRYFSSADLLQWKLSKQTIPTHPNS